MQLFVKGAAIVALMCGAAMSGQAVSKDLDRDELETICHLIDQQIPVMFPCNYSYELQTIDIIFSSNLHDFKKELEFHRACKLASVLFFEKTESHETIWTLTAYTDAGGPPIGVCDLTYVRNTTQ